MLHKGIDIPAWPGAPIVATADGIVIYASTATGFGLLVAISHRYGFQTLYGHCSKLLVRKGQQVKKGQIIAQVGSTGRSTGPHLHYEVRRRRGNKVVSLKPNSFLDLDIFTANEMVW